MKNLILAAALFTAAVLPAAAQTNVSVSIGQPGFYGRIDIGDFAAPPVFVAQPVIIEREVRYVAEPVYLRVPPGHRKNWSRYCRRYEACGRPVYFVRDDWYLNDYAPRYRERHVRDDRRDYAEGYRDGRREERRDERHHGKGHDKHDKHDKGHGRGNGRGRD